MKLNIQDEEKQWFVVSEESCPICKYKIGLAKFATSEDAYLYLGETLELDLTGTDK